MYQIQVIDVVATVVVGVVTMTMMTIIRPHSLIRVLALTQIRIQVRALVQDSPPMFRSIPLPRTAAQRIYLGTV